MLYWHAGVADWQIKIETITFKKLHSKAKFSFIYLFVCLFTFFAIIYLEGKLDGIIRIIQVVQI